MRNLILPLLASLGLSITGCAGAPSGQLSRETRKEEYNRFAGEPVRQVRMLKLHSWTSIDRDQVVLWSTSRKAYLVDLFVPCLNLAGARAIGVSSFGSTVYAGSDAILVGNERCLIDQIRPIDTKGLNEERRAARNTARLEARPDQ